MIADALLIHPDEGLVVCGTDVEEGSRIRFRLELKSCSYQTTPSKRNSVGS
jgi:hypothetical protein